eukprot:GHVS01070080.1.p1 GENE.GHVS01070080.1~~GHVS01070080.1.p1  ORF type:complete len:1595 (-),score=229.71 GHVS01070080.1:283-4674(-)
MLATRAVVRTQRNTFVPSFCRHAPAADRRASRSRRRSSSSTTTTEFLTSQVSLLPKDAPVFLYQRISGDGSSSMSWPHLLLAQDDIVNRFRPQLLSLGVTETSLTQFMIIPYLCSTTIAEDAHWLTNLSCGEFAEMYAYLARQQPWTETQRKQMELVPLLCTDAGLVTLGACERGDQTVFLPNPSLQQTLEASSLSTVSQAIQQVATCSFLAEDTRVALETKTVKWLEAELHVLPLSKSTFYSRLIKKSAECVKRFEYATSPDFQKLLIVLTHCLSNANTAEFQDILGRLPVVIAVSSTSSYTAEQLFQRYVERHSLGADKAATAPPAVRSPGLSVANLAVDPAALRRRSRRASRLCVGRGHDELQSEEVEVVVPLAMPMLTRVFPTAKDRAHFVQLTGDYAQFELQAARRLDAERLQAGRAAGCGGVCRKSMWTFLALTAHASCMGVVPPLPRSLSWLRAATEEVVLSSEAFAFHVERAVLFVNLCCYHLRRLINENKSTWNCSTLRAFISPSLLTEIETAYWLPCTRGRECGQEAAAVAEPRLVLCRPKDVFLGTDNVCEVLGELRGTMSSLVWTLWNRPSVPVGVCRQEEGRGFEGLLPALSFVYGKMAENGDAMSAAEELWGATWTEQQLEALYEAFGVVTSLRGEAVIPFLVALKHSRKPAEPGDNWHLPEQEVALLCRLYSRLVNQHALLDNFDLIYFPLLPQSHSPLGGSWYSSMSFGDSVVWSQTPEYFAGALLSVVGSCPPNVLDLVGPFFKELTDFEPGADHYMRFWMAGCPDLVAAEQFHLIEWFLCEAASHLSRHWHHVSNRHGATHASAQSLKQAFKVGAPVWDAHARVFVERSGRSRPIYVDDMLVPFSPEDLQCHVAFAPSESMQTFLVEMLGVQRLSTSLRVQAVKLGHLSAVPEEHRLITSHALTALRLLLENKFGMTSSRNVKTKDDVAESPAGIVACIAAVSECVADSIELRYALKGKPNALLRPTAADVFFIDQGEQPSSPQILGSEDDVARFAAAGQASTLILSAACDSHRVWILKSSRELVKMLRRRLTERRINPTATAVGGGPSRSPAEYVMQQLHNFLGRRPEELCDELSMQGVYVTPRNLFAAQGRRGGQQFGPPRQSLTQDPAISAASQGPRKQHHDGRYIVVGQQGSTHFPSSTSANRQRATVASPTHAPGLRAEGTASAPSPFAGVKGPSAAARRPLTSHASERLTAMLSTTGSTTAAAAAAEFTAAVLLTDDDRAARERCALPSVPVEAAAAESGRPMEGRIACKSQDDDLWMEDWEPPIEDDLNVVGRWGEELAFRRLVPRWVIDELRKKGVAPESLRADTTDQSKLDSGRSLVYCKTADGREEAIVEIQWVNQTEELGDAVDVTVRGAINADIEVKATTTRNWIFRLSGNQTIRWVANPNQFRLMLIRDVYSDQPEFVVIKDLPAALDTRMLSLRKCIMEYHHCPPQPPLPP